MRSPVFQDFLLPRHEYGPGTQAGKERDSFSSRLGSRPIFMAGKRESRQDYKVRWSSRIAINFIHQEQEPF